MTFLGVAHTIAYPLARQKYFPGKNPKTNQLLIMVYWGTTRVPVPANESAAYATLQIANQNLQSILQAQGPPSGTAKNAAGSLAARNMNLNNPMIASAAYAADAALGMAIAENRITDRQNERNAAILGYDSWWNSTSDDLALGPAALAQRQDVIDELEDERYYVVLMAYDWQTLSREKQHNLLWETRFSIRSRHNDFSKELAAMAQKASRYFGSSSDGLVHLVPEGHVWWGEAKPVADTDSNK
jgi:hypothetical protein